MNNLKRSNSNKVFAGVCGGIGEFFNIDPTIIRILWALAFVKSFQFALISYVLGILIMPIDDGVIYSDDNHQDQATGKISKKPPIFIGLGLIIWGIFLLSEIIFPGFNLKIAGIIKYWPVLLIFLGLYIIYNQKNSN